VHRCCRVASPPLRDWNIEKGRAQWRVPSGGVLACSWSLWPRPTSALFDTPLNSPYIAAAVWVTQWEAGVTTPHSGRYPAWGNVRNLLIAVAGISVIMTGSLGCRDTRAGAPRRVLDLGGRFQAASFMPREPAAPTGRYERHRSALEVGANGRVFSLSSSGSLVITLDPFADAAVLTFDYRIDRPGAAGSGSLNASLIDSEGQRRELSALANPTEDWTTAELHFGVGSDDYQFVVLEVVLDDGSHSVRFRRPQLQLGKARGPRPDQEVTPLSADALPNVLIVILDAARASNFGAYGYERDTTPSIDRFAAEALVFRKAFSECATTSCSIPNLISGIPFLDMGTSDNPRMNDRIVTLAEYLADQGYRTIGLSSNANNGISRNSSQGFDEFVEMWNLEGDQLDPRRLSGRAIEALRGVDPKQPVLMLLHYRPPHEPYSPSPEFNIFGDPAYAGPVRSGQEVQIRETYGVLGDPADMVSVPSNGQDQRRMSPGDLEEMIALYDGNLRMADDAVGEVFDALRVEGRWDNSIILVTADHGEAFFEHGHQGHNTTLYDEMLHIPFILRLPEGRVANDVDTDRLVILSDVVPTILGQLGLEPRDEVGGVDLLLDGDQATSRVIFHRMGHRLLSARTQKWNAIFTLIYDAPMLFDLAEDPGELENTVDDSPLIHHGFAALLNEHLREVEARTDFAAGSVELPEDEIRALRALGYVQ